MAKSSAGNYTTITTNNHDGTQTERTFASHQERQQFLRQRGQENPANIPHQKRTVERTGGDSD